MRSITDLNYTKKLDPIAAKCDFIFSAYQVPSIHGIIRDVSPDEKGAIVNKRALSKVRATITNNH